MIAILGWFGSLLYIVNHGYISSVKQWQGRIYYSGNLIAAVSLVISSFIIASYQAVVINNFWAIVSFLLMIHFDVSSCLSRNVFSMLALLCLWLLFCYFR